jgi:transcriptional regulator with XRE-family HTH domain
MGLTQGQLAARLRTTLNTIARWERDEVEISGPVSLLIEIVAREAGVADSATNTGGRRQVAPPKPAKSSRATYPKGKGRKSKSTIQRKRR